MKKIKKMLIISIIIIFIIICGYCVFNIINYMEFRNKYSMLINSPDGSIDLNEDICSMFENDKSFSYIVKNIKYNENEVKSPRIYFVNAILSYINDNKKLKPINGIDYNYPEIQNGTINCYLSKKNFLKLFKETYNISLTENDLVKNEDFMGAFYKKDDKVLFSKLDELEDNEIGFMKITSLNKSKDIYQMNVRCYSFQNDEEMELFKNNEETSVKINDKTLVFRLNRFNRYFNYSIISIE